MLEFEVWIWGWENAAGAIVELVAVSRKLEWQCYCLTPFPFGNAGSCWFGGVGIGVGAGLGFAFDPTAGDPYGFKHPAAMPSSDITMYTGVRGRATAKFLGFGADGTLGAGLSGNGTDVEISYDAEIGGPLATSVGASGGRNSTKGPYGPKFEPNISLGRSKAVTSRLFDFGARLMALKEYGFSKCSRNSHFEIGAGSRKGALAGKVEARLG